MPPALRSSAVSVVGSQASASSSQTWRTKAAASMRWAPMVAARSSGVSGVLVLPLASADMTCAASSPGNRLARRRSRDVGRTPRTRKPDGRVTSS